jgi:hypothetical protein
LTLFPSYHKAWRDTSEKCALQVPEKNAAVSLAKAPFDSPAAAVRRAPPRRPK